MKIARVYTGPDGETHIGDIDYPEDEKRTADKWSKPIKTEEIELSETHRVREKYEWHNPHRRLMGITIAGTHEIETSDGSKHLAEPGDIIIFEDTTGKGHVSRQVSSPPHKMVFVMLS